jgi:hypothetical protein
MYSGAIVSMLLILTCIPEAYADRLEAAAKGKKQAVQLHYGEVSSFDGTTVLFEEVSPPPSGSDKRARLLGESQPVRIQFAAKDAEISIALGARDSQEPVDPSHPENNIPQRTKDVDLQHAEAQRKEGEARNNLVEADLTHCSGRGIDQIVEKDAQSDGATKPPIQGELQSIGGGIAILKRASDGAIRKYRLDELAEIRIGMCQ